MRVRKRDVLMLLGCRPDAAVAVTVSAPVSEDGLELQVLLTTRFPRIRWNAIATEWTSR